jgi:Derlin-2/3
MHLNIMGVFNIRAPYFPWFLLGVGLVSNGNLFYYLCGIGIGHVYYFFDDVVPNLPFCKGFRLFRAPPMINNLCKALGMECQRELVLEDGDFVRDDEWN